MAATGPRYARCPSCQALRDTSGRYTSPANAERDRLAWEAEHGAGRCAPPHEGDTMPSNPTDDQQTQPGASPQARVLVLCRCCALKLANDDESGCRDHHGHTHAGVEVPAGTVVAGGPVTWDGAKDLPCEGHEDGVVVPGEEFWFAEALR